MVEIEVLLVYKEQKGRHQPATTYVSPQHFYHNNRFYILLPHHSPEVVHR